jgi:hypothetical protein
MPSTNWYTWPTEAEFDTWHNGVVQALHLPRVGINAATGLPDPDAQWTTAYTAVVEVADGDWRAPVEQRVASDFADGLGVLSESPPAPEVLL